MSNIRVRFDPAISTLHTQVWRRHGLHSFANSYFFRHPDNNGVLHWSNIDGQPVDGLIHDRDGTLLDPPPFDETLLEQCYLADERPVTPAEFRDHLLSFKNPAVYKDADCTDDEWYNMYTNVDRVPDGAIYCNTPFEYHKVTMRHTVCGIEWTGVYFNGQLLTVLFKKEVAQ